MKMACLRAMIFTFRIQKKDICGSRHVVEITPATFVRGWRDISPRSNSDGNARDDFKDSETGHRAYRVSCNIKNRLLERIAI